jgi:peroxiredoxin
MTISVGDRVPSLTLTKAGESGPEQISSDEYFKGRKVALFSVPGAFTPTCSARHLPGYIDKADELKAKGVDEIAFTSVNDAFVMGAWGRSESAGEEFIMIADPDAAFTTAMGMDTDASAFGLGTRSERYAAILKDGVITSLDVEKQFVDLEVSSAESVLAKL